LVRYSCLSCRSIYHFAARWWTSSQARNGAWPWTTGNV